MAAGDRSKEAFEPAQHGLDAAVRNHLENEAARVDATAMMQNLFARLDRETVPLVKPVTHRPARRWLAAAAMLAASLLLAIFLVGPGRGYAASPMEAVRSARAAHADETVRCYTVTHIRPTGFLAGRIENTPRLCVRGGSFQVTVPDVEITWGRDDKGRIWLAPTRNVAARFEPAELPETLREIVAIRGLELPELLDEVLSDFDLVWQNDDPHTRTVVATRQLRAGPLQITSAEIQLAQESDLIEQLTLKRQTAREGVMTITFKLDQETHGHAGAFSAEGNLELGGEVFDGRQPFKRMLVLMVALREAMSKGL